MSSFLSECLVCKKSFCSKTGLILHLKNHQNSKKEKSPSPPKVGQKEASIVFVKKRLWTKNRKRHHSKSKKWIPESYNEMNSNWRWKYVGGQLTSAKLLTRKLLSVVISHPPQMKSVNLMAQLAVSLTQRPPSLTRKSLAEESLRKGIGTSRMKIAVPLKLPLNRNANFASKCFAILAIFLSTHSPHISSKETSVPVVTKCSSQNGPK